MRYIENSEQVRSPINVRDSREVYTPVEVMGKLFVGKSKVYELLRTGRLQSFRVGKQYRIHDSDLQSYIEHNKTL